MKGHHAWLGSITHHLDYVNGRPKRHLHVMAERAMTHTIGHIAELSHAPIAFYPGFGQAPLAEVAGLEHGSANVGSPVVASFVTNVH